MHLSDGFYEIIGSVKEDRSIKALTSIELGSSVGRSPRPCDTLLARRRDEALANGLQI
jgi:hypothetical protein